MRDDVRGTHLDLGPQHNVRIPSICQAKNPSELVHRQLADVANLQLWGLPYDTLLRSRPKGLLRETYLCAHLQFHNLDPIRYDWRLVALVEGRLEHLDGIGVKLVGEARPFEGE